MQIQKYIEIDDCVCSATLLGCLPLNYQKQDLDIPPFGYALEILFTFKFKRTC